MQSLGCFSDIAVKVQCSLPMGTVDGIIVLILLLFSGIFSNKPIITTSASCRHALWVRTLEVISLYSSAVRDPVTFFFFFNCCCRIFFLCYSTDWELEFCVFFLAFRNRCWGFIVTRFAVFWKGRIWTLSGFLTQALQRQAQTASVCCARYNWIQRWMLQTGSGVSSIVPVQMRK